MIRKQSLLKQKIPNKEIQRYLEQLNLNCQKHIKPLLFVCLEKDCEKQEPICQDCQLFHKKHENKLLTLTQFMQKLQFVEIEESEGYSQKQKKQVQQIFDAFELIESHTSFYILNKDESLIQQLQTYKKTVNDFFEIKNFKKQQIKKNYELFFEDSKIIEERDDPELSFIIKSIIAIDKTQKSQKCLKISHLELLERAENFNKQLDNFYKNQIQPQISPNKIFLQMSDQSNKNNTKLNFFNQEDSHLQEKQVCSISLTEQNENDLNDEKLQQQQFQEQSQQMFINEEEENKINQAQINLVFTNQIVGHLKNDELKEIVSVSFISENKIITIGKDNQARIFRLSPLEQIFSFEVKLPPQYLILFIRSRQMLCITDQKSTQILSFYRIFENKAVKVQKLGKTEIRNVLYSICYRENQNLLLTLQKNDAKHSNFCIYNIHNKKCVQNIKLKGSFYSLDTFDNIPYVFFGDRKRNEISVYNFWNRKELISNFQIENNQKFKLYSFFSYFNNSLVDSSNSQGFSLQIACSFTTNLENSNIAQEIKVQGKYEFKIKIFQLNIRLQQLETLIDIQQQNHIIGFIWSPLHECLFYQQCFDSKNFRNTTFGQEEIESRMKKEEDFQTFKIGIFYDIQKDALLKNRTLFAQQSAQITSFSFNRSQKSLVLVQENGKIKEFLVEQKNC